MTGDDDSVKPSPFTLTPTLSPFGKLLRLRSGQVRAGINGGGVRGMEKRSIER